MSIKGLKAHTDRLKKLSSQMIVKEVGKALFAAGERIATHAKISITAGAVSGKEHVPSKPGEPPNNDTGVLANNIETTQIAPLIVQVASKAPYAASLEFGYEIEKGTKRARSFKDRIGPRATKMGPVLMEFGNSKIAARPYMKPARDENLEETQNIVQKAVNKAVKKSRSGDS